MNVAVVYSTPPAVDHHHDNSHLATTNPALVSSSSSCSSPLRTRDLSLLLPTMSKQQRDALMERSPTRLKKPWTIVDPTNTTGSEKLQQLKESLREQRRRHATIGSKSHRICSTSDSSSSSQNQPPKCITMKSTTTGSNGSSGNSTISVDETTNSNSQCSSTGCNGDATTVTTAPSTTIDSHGSDAGSSSDTSSHQPSSYSNRILQQLSGGISPLSCNTTTARTPTSNPVRDVHQRKNLHLHKSIQVPNLEVSSPTGSTDSCDYTNASPTNAGIDNCHDDDEESTASSVKPPTLEEIYAAMGETLDRASLSPSPLFHRQGNQSTVQSSLQAVEKQSLGDTGSGSVTFPASPKQSTICTTFPSTPPTSNHPLPLDGVNPNIDAGRNKVKRSSYISKLYDSPTRIPSSTRRPTTGLCRFEQRIQQEQQKKGGENVMNDTDNNIETATLGLHRKTPSSFEEASLSDDVLDSVASTPMAISIDTTSSATLSLSESILDSDDDDNDDADECDYTTNSDTSGWASMGDSTAGPLGCLDSIADYVSVGSIGTSPLMHHTVTELSSLHFTEVAQPPVDPTKTISSSTKPAISSERKHKLGKTKNTVTFQIETIEVNTTQNPAWQEQEKQLQNEVVKQALKPRSSIGTSTVHKPLFVTARRADELCRTNGGHFYMALRCGMKVLPPSSEKRIPLVPLKIVPTSPVLNVRLSTDFRCGTYGSLYDIAMRSGGSGNGFVLRSDDDAFASDNSDVKKSERKTRTRVIRTSTTTTRKIVDSQRPYMLPNIAQQTEEPKNTAQSSGKGKLTRKQPATSYVPVRGGFYDMVALQSGSTNDGLRSRTSITWKPSMQRQQCGSKKKPIN